MQVRCGLAFLSFTVLIGLNLLSEELLHLDQLARQENLYQAEDGSESFAALRAQSSAELFRGQYRLHSNGSEGSEGLFRLKLGSHPTSVPAVQISSILITLIGAERPGRGGNLQEQDIDLHLVGVEMGSARQLTASGATGLADFGPVPCRLDAVLNLRGEHDKETELAGEVSSANCKFSLQLSATMVDKQRATRKAVHYALWVNTLTTIQMRCFLSQMRYTTDEGPSAAKLSLLGIAMQALMDAYDAFLHLSLGASSRYAFNTFAWVALLKGVLFVLLEVRYILSIWRQRHRDLFAEGWEVVRRELSRIYSYFYGALICGLLLISNFMDYLGLIALAFQAFWLPQIIHDVRHGSKNTLEPQFIMGISATRCLTFLYLWGCPLGVFDGDFYPKLAHAPSLWLCIMAVLLQGAQLAVMASQKILGPRWFVPWLCLPHAYNYRRHVDVMPSSDCVICMGELDQEDGRLLAVAPCNHRFHRQCLEQWMDVKMECPTCRAELPPMG